MTARTLADIDWDLIVAHDKERDYLASDELALASQQHHQVDRLLDERCKAMGLQPAV